MASALLLENLGLPLPGETVLLLASLLAYTEHDLRIGWIIVVGTMATIAGSMLGYVIGQYGGRPLLERYRTSSTLAMEPSGEAKNCLADTALSPFFLHDSFSGCA